MTDRRAFLQGLASLPLIGGSVALIGQPSAAAESATTPMLVSYANWLFYERRFLCSEIAQREPKLRELERVCFLDPGLTDLDYDRKWNWPDFHFDARREGQPSTRAAVVMAASGFDWRPVPRAG